MIDIKIYFDNWKKFAKNKRSAREYDELYQDQDFQKWLEIQEEERDEQEYGNLWCDIHYDTEPWMFGVNPAYD
jgi:hypothetical protein